MYIVDVICYVIQMMYNFIYGVRGSVFYVVVFVIDGGFIIFDIIKVQVQIVKDNNVILYGVGVGLGVNMQELILVISDFDLRYVLKVDSYGFLDVFFNGLFIKICNGKC